MNIEKYIILRFNDKHACLNDHSEKNDMLVTGPTLSQKKKKLFLPIFCHCFHTKIEPDMIFRFNDKNSS